MAIEHARDVYTRRQEGVSIWVVRSSEIIASDPADADALFEPAQGQGLPAPDVLRDSGRGQEPVSDAALLRSTLLRLARHEPGPRAAPRRVGRACAGARRGPRARQHLARPDRPGAPAADVRRRARRPRPHRGRSRVPARRHGFPATSRSPSSRTAISAQTIVRQCCSMPGSSSCTSALQHSTRAQARRDRREGAQGNALSLPLQRRLAGAARRRHGREPAARADARSMSCGASRARCSSPMRVDARDGRAPASRRDLATLARAAGRARRRSAAAKRR